MKPLAVFLVLLAFANAQPSSRRAVVHMAVPSYPRLAWMAQIEGDVHIKLLVGKDGKVKGYDSFQGPELLRNDTETNIFTWVFTDGAEDEKIDIVYEYRLVPKRSVELTSWVVLQSPQRITIYADGPEPNN